MLLSRILGHQNGEVQRLGSEKGGSKCRNRGSKSRLKVARVLGVSLRVGSTSFHQDSLLNPLLSAASIIQQED